MDVSDSEVFEEKSESKCLRVKVAIGSMCGPRDVAVDGAGQKFSSWDFRLDGGARSRRRRRAFVRDRHHLGSGPRLVLRAVQVLLVEAPLGQERLRRGER